MAASNPSKRKNPYDVHPAINMVVDWIANLKSKTGRSLDEWMRFINESGPGTEVERSAWLKKEFGMGTNTAGWLAERSVGKGSEEDTPEGYLKLAVQYVEAQYSGKKEPLRPLFDDLVKIARDLGADVKVCPAKTMVSLIRNHVFAQIKPTTITRIDLGFALGDRKPSGSLIDTGGFAKKDRITHRVEIAGAKDINAEVKKWLKLAYELDQTNET